MKAYLKSNENDLNDVAAIAEARIPPKFCNVIATQWRNGRTAQAPNLDTKLAFAGRRNY